MRAPTLARAVLVLLLGYSLAQAWLGRGERVLDAGFHHLGNDATPDWKEAAVQPEGTRLDLDFESGPNGKEWVLSIRARSVDNPWHVELNGRRVASLRKGAELQGHYYPVEAGSLLVGTNHLAIVPEVPTDDITVGDIRLIESSLRELLELVPLEVGVRELGSERPLPARLSLVDESGAAVEVYYATGERRAVRDGLVYTGDGEARLELPAGRYRLHATRGMEWSLGRAEVELARGASAPARVDLHLARVVDTRGYVATDTHIHTLTHSGHGDASVPERMVTLAGEGVELAIATDHNHNTDYRPDQAALGLQPWFTPVVGNEVTTEVGHFNAFPLDPAQEVPDYKSTDYTTLVAGMRAKGAQVVILNHPRWPEHETGPFGKASLDPYTGARANDLPCPFDATELVNATSKEEDPLYLFRDWFALLNRGEKVAAVGSSDSHTVGDPVGQGRTYVASASDDPTRIDVDEACRNIAGGRSSIAQGIFVEAWADGAARMGELAPLHERRVTLALRVASAEWVHPEKARLFVNGIERTAFELERSEGAIDIRLEKALDWPYPHDAWVVWVVTGPGVPGGFWPLLNDYTLGATNPIFLDVDGDGRYTSPRDYAAARTSAARAPEDFETALAGCDSSVAVHVLDLARATFAAEARAALRRSAGPFADDERVRAWLAGLPAPR